MTHEIAIGDKVEWTNTHEDNYSGPMLITAIDNELGLVFIHDRGWTARSWIRTCPPAAHVTESGDSKMDERR